MNLYPTRHEWSLEEYSFDGALRIRIESGGWRRGSRIQISKNNKGRWLWAGGSIIAISCFYFLFSAFF